MAQNGNSIMTFLLAITMVTIMIFFSSAAMAQDIAMAPTPPMETGLDTGDGFGFPVSEALVCFSVLFSMMVVLFH
ncbi:hypothetical protein RND71_036123 [Anisodus tanguticus]|uniref:Transmembrane protein n=1 Tax=Anisodus tanguticus TaxID=243964 RepID=A0AAE1R8X3_9SOLA|nr:hypothetical protein RND71_036123 [Anisodus tanguticus]